MDEDQIIIEDDEHKGIYEFIWKNQAKIVCMTGAQGDHDVFVDMNHMTEEYPSLDQFAKRTANALCSLIETWNLSTVDIITFTIDGIMLKKDSKEYSFMTGAQSIEQDWHLGPIWSPFQVEDLKEID